MMFKFTLLPNSHLPKGIPTTFSTVERWRMQRKCDVLSLLVVAFRITYGTLTHFVGTMTVFRVHAVVRGGWLAQYAGSLAQNSIGRSTDQYAILTWPKTGFHKEGIRNMMLIGWKHCSQNTHKDNHKDKCLKRSFHVVLISIIHGVHEVKIRDNIINNVHMLYYVFGGEKKQYIKAMHSPETSKGCWLSVCCCRNNS